MKKTKLLATSLIASLVLLPCSYSVAATSTTVTDGTTISNSNNANLTVSDADIVNAIKKKINQDKSITSSQISITSLNGNVTLKGKVATSHDSSTIIELAESTTGVKNVDTSKLKTTKSSQPYADSYITAKVKGTFMREELFGKQPVPVMSINVETKNGVVYLSGTADTAMQAKNAVSLARSIKGVTDVQSKVVVKNK